MYESHDRLGQMSIALLLMYVMIFSNGIKSIVGCNIRHALSNNMIMQHITAFVILLFFIVITTRETNQGAFGKNLAFSIVVYLWFVMLTRVQAGTFLLVLVILLIAYAIGKFVPITEDKQRKIQSYQAALTIVAVSITIVSFIHYIHDIKAKHAESFRWHKFISQPPKCKQCKLRSGKCV